VLDGHRARFVAYTAVQPGLLFSITLTPRRQRHLLLLSARWACIWQLLRPDCRVRRRGRGLGGPCRAVRTGSERRLGFWGRL